MARLAVVGTVLVGSLALAALDARPASAAIVYMGPNEANKTLKQAFAAMKGGDTLIIRDGTYTGVANRIGDGTMPPAGTEGARTVLRAEHDGAVTFDGESVRAVFFMGGSDTLIYTDFYGLKWVNINPSAQSTSVVLIEGNDANIHHVRFFRCGAKTTRPASKQSTWSVSAGSYILLEECYAWGGGRYGFSASAGGTYGASKVIFRRCVLRADDVDGNWNPTSGFTSYTAPQIEWQNCIVIDIDTSYYSRISYMGSGFTWRKHSTPDANYGYCEDCHNRGSIVLNVLGWTHGGSDTSTYLAGLELSSETASPNSVTDVVLWGVMQATLLPGTTIGSPTMRNLSVRVADDPSGVTALTGSRGIWLGAPWSLKNSVVLHGQRYSMRGSMTSDYNAVFSDTIDFYTNSSNGHPGSHDYTDDLGSEYNPLTGLPGGPPPIGAPVSTVGNGTIGLKYITQVEPGSDLYGTGENGANRGATVLKRYGVSGTVWGEPGYNTLTDEDLWPFPYEAQIRADMRAYSPPGGPTGTRGFCADGETLTNYIWGYLGNTVPPLGLVATPGDRSVTLNWARPADIALPTIAGFNIYRVDGGQHSLVGTVDGNETYTATVTGLAPSSPHIFAMTTVDLLKGESGYSEPVTVTPVSTQQDPGGSPGGTPATQTAPTIAWATPASIVAGTPLSAAQLNATANVAGTFAYTPTAGAVLQVGTHTVSVLFTPADTTLYTTARAWMSLVVTALPPTAPTITWAAPAPIVEGTSVGAAQLNATASVPGTFVYSPAAGAVLSAGTHTLSATFTPTDTERYTTASASVSLLVNALPPTAPTITWAAPAPIVQGTALGGTQLNATASVPGTFVYSPAAGAVLSAGTHTLSATFTPTDTTRYTTATASTSLVVTARRRRSRG